MILNFPLADVFIFLKCAFSASASAKGEIYCGAGRLALRGMKRESANASAKNNKK